MNMAQDKGTRDAGGHDFERPISNGPNARPRDETISQTGRGLPDDSSRPVEIDPEEERKIADQIRKI
jgi:hypothetical protein